MSPHGLRNADEVIGFPRVSGDEPTKLTPREILDLFSPRERG